MADEEDFIVFMVFIDEAVLRALVALAVLAVLLRILRLAVVLRALVRVAAQVRVPVRRLAAARRVRVRVAVLEAVRRAVVGRRRMVLRVFRRVELRVMMIPILCKGGLEERAGVRAG